MGKTNRWLCKNFDIEHKGYVTFGWMIRIVIVTMIFVFIILTILYSIFRFFYLGSFWVNTESIRGDAFFGIGATVILAIITVLAVALIILSFRLLVYILNIKIAVCELKDDKK